MSKKKATKNIQVIDGAINCDGILFYQHEEKKQFYPTRLDEEASIHSVNV